MLKKTSSYRIPLFVAIGLHFILLIVMMIELPRKADYRSETTNTHQKIVHAVAVNQKQVAVEMAKMEQEKARKQRAEKTRLHRLQQAALAAKRKRIKEQHRVSKLRAEKKRLEQERAKERRLARERKRRKEKARQLALKKKRERIAKKKRLQEQHARELAKKQRELRKKLLAQQMAAEQKNIEKAQVLQTQGILDKYKAQIIQAIQQVWIVPNSSNKKASCVLLIDLAPGGVVLSVKILHSSGNAVLDRSARVAVFKASPLPVPKDPALFDKFRELRLTVRPEEIKS